MPPGMNKNIVNIVYNTIFFSGNLTEDGDYEDLYVGNDPDTQSEGCDRDRVQCQVIEVSGDTRNYANGKYKPAKTGPHGTRYKNTKRQRFMIVSDKRNKFLLALMNTDENKPGFKILTTGKQDPKIF